MSSIVDDVKTQMKHHMIDVGSGFKTFDDGLDGLARAAIRAVRSHFVKAAEQAKFMEDKAALWMIVEELEDAE